MPDGHLYIFFGKMSIQVFCLFVFFLIRSVFLSVSSISCLYTLDINPLSDIFANIFSHSVDCTFMLLVVFFAIQKFLHLIRSHLFPCLFFALETDPKKMLLPFISNSVLPMFSSRSFMCFGRIFKPFNPF